MDESHGVVIKSDRARIWLLLTIIIVAGALAGLALVNTIAFIGLMIGLIITIVRYGWRYCLIAASISMGLCFFLYGPIIMGGMFLLFVLPAMLMGHKARLFGTHRQILIWGLMVYAFPLFLLVILYPQLIAGSETFAREMSQQLAAESAVLGITGADMQSYLASLETVFEWTLKLAPGILATTFVAFVVFAYLGASAVAPRFGAILPAMTPFAFWKGHDLWLLPLGSALLLLLIGGPTARIIGYNIGLFMVHVYAVFGLAIIEFFLSRTLSLGWPRHFLYILMLLAAIIFIPMLAVIGLLDSRFDLRRLSEERA